MRIAGNATNPTKNRLKTISDLQFLISRLRVVPDGDDRSEGQSTCRLSVPGECVTRRACLASLRVNLGGDRVSVVTGQLRDPSDDMTDPVDPGHLSPQRPRHYALKRRLARVPACPPAAVRTPEAK